MATLSALDAEIATDLEALSPITTRMASDFRRDRETVASATASYQLRAWRMEENQMHSGASRKRIRVQVDVHQQVPTIASERTLMLAGLDTTLTSILTRSFWSDMAAVYKVVDDGDEFPTVTEAPELTARVMSFGVAVELWLQE